MLRDLIELVNGANVDETVRPFILYWCLAAVMMIDNLFSRVGDVSEFACEALDAWLVEWLDEIINYSFHSS